MNSIEFAEIIILNGGLRYLLQLIQKTENRSIIKYCIWAIHDLCNHEPRLDYQLKNDLTFGIAKVIMKQDDIHVLRNATRTFKRNASFDDEIIKFTIDSGFLSKLMDLLKFILFGFL